jgi:hypothetical protein
MKSGVKAGGQPILAAAVIASFGIYAIVPLLRGAVWGLFPGIANRSLKLGAKGVAFGALFDLFYEVAWVATISQSVLNMAWEPRAGYNEFLVSWLPGGLGGCTHRGSPWSNGMQFWSAIVVWIVWMTLCWWVVWKPRLSLPRLVCALAAGAASSSVACGILWVVSPMNRYSGRNSEFPFGFGFHGLPWVITFMSVFPLSAIAIAYCFKGNAEPGVGADSR